MTWCRAYIGGNRSYIQNLASEPDLLDYLVQNGIEFTHMIPANALTDTAAAAALIDTWETAIDNNIGMWISIEMAMGEHGVVYESTTADDYESLFGDCIDLYEAVSTFKGYSWEAGFGTGMEWLHDRTQKLIWYYIFDSNNSSIPSNTDQPLTWICAHCDQIVWEVYWVYEAVGTLLAINWLHENIQNMQQGVITAFSVPGGGFWSDQFWGDTISNPTLEQEQLLAVIYLRQMQVTNGGLESALNSIELMFDTPTYASSLSQLQFLVGLGITEPWPPTGEIEDITATLSTNQNITVPIGWNV